MKPPWIGAAAMALLIVSATTAVVRTPAVPGPTSPVAVPATQATSSPPTDAEPDTAVDTSVVTEAATGDPVDQPTGEATASPSATESAWDEPTEAALPLASGPWSHARAGLYHYTTDGTSGLVNDQRRMPNLTTLRISDGGRDGFQARVRDLRDERGDGQLVALDLHVREDGIELARITTATRVATGALTDTRTFAADPPGLLIATDDHRGHTHRFLMYSGATTVTVTIILEGTRTVTIGDEQVQAFVVDQHLKFEGDVVGTTSAHLWLRVGDLLPLHERVESDVEAGGARYVSTYRADLTSLTPT